MEEINKEEEKTNYFYYRVPLKKDERSKEVFVISEKEKYEYCHIANQIRSHVQKNRLDWGVTNYNFPEYIRGAEYRQMYNMSVLDEDIQCTKATYDDFIKRFVPVCQEKFGTHLRIDISTGEMKEYWSSFVRMTILERLIKKIQSQARNLDVFIILLMESREEALFTEIKNEFSKINSRLKLFFVHTGIYDSKKHISFASALQKNYSTEELTHKLCYHRALYSPGNDIYYDDYTFISDVTNDIIPNLSFTETAEVDVLLQQYPWSPESTKVIRGSYVLSKVNHELIPIKYTKEEYLHEQLVDIDTMINIYSTWVNQIMIGYGVNSFSKEDIESAIKFLTEFMVNYVDNIDLSSIPKNKPIQNMTVRQRLIAQQSNRCYFSLVIMIKQLSDLLLKDTVGDLSKEEEIERQKIGTQIGKFHQRALVMRGLDVETFTKMKNFFIEELIKAKPSIKFESDQERSIFSLENMKDVFLQEDIVDGLREVKSQYHLISAFPLIGLGVKLKRSDGSMINPYMVQVLDIARINANVDTVSIQNTPDKELNLNAGFYIGAEYGTRDHFEANHGYKPLKWTQYQPRKEVLKDLNECQLFYYKSEQLKERIDAVVPLFGPRDYDLKPVLQTSFFHILMNFNVMHNVDTCFSEAYLALLASTLIFLLNQEKSSYVDELLDKIYHSVNIVYADRPFFKTYCETLISQPRHAMVTFHEGHPTQCQDPSKALIILFFLVKNGDLTDRVKIKEILEAILQELVARGVKNLELLHTYFGVVGYDTNEFNKIEQEVIKTDVGDVLQYPTVRQMMQKVELALRTKNYFAFTKKLKLFIYKESFNFMSYGKLNFFTSMKAICNYFLPSEKFDGSLLWIWLLHAQKYPNNYTRNTSEMNKDIKKVYVNIKRQKCVFFIKEESLKIYSNCYKILQPRFQKEMVQLHLTAIPYCQALIDPLFTDQTKFNVKYNNVSNLSKNCCFCPKCPFYLQRMTNISEHIKDIQSNIPGFHKTVKMMYQRETQQIYEAICQGRHLDHEKKEEYVKQAQRLFSDQVQNQLLKKNKEHYLNLIEELVAQYKRIIQKEH